jgi:uncharacterized protein YfbU (UPF0304 family)
VLAPGGRWAELRNEMDDYNSGSPMLDRYRVMQREYKSLTSGRPQYKLSKDEIEQITSARPK